MPTLRELGEFEALRRLAATRRERPTVIVGPGDDAAVLRPAPGCDLVATTDAFVEGRHWLAEWFTPSALGARLAVANLSDLAAMAATPRWALLSIGVREDHAIEPLVELQRAIEETLGREEAGIVGGNLTAVEGAEWLNLTLLGETAMGRAWTRFGARPGDLLAVSGHPGRAGAGVLLARALGEKARAPEWQPLIDAWMAPASRGPLARALAVTGGVMAAIDVSDGLAGDLAHLCEASGVGAEIDTAALAEDAALARAAAALKVKPLDLALGPSDDYELLLAIDPSSRAECERIAHDAGVPLRAIGTFTDAPGTLVGVGSRGARAALEPRGFDHFAADRS
jgi:thiamine-monophosphate kinase